MKNLPKEKRDRIVLILVSTLIVLIAIWQGVIKLQNKRLAKMAQMALEEDTRVNNAERLIQSADQINEKLGGKVQSVKAMEADMASGDMYSWIILKINKFKAGYNVDIPQFSREVPTEVGVLANFPYKAALFNIRGKAYFHDLGRFIADFENEFSYLRIQNIEMEPANSSNETSSDAEKYDEKLTFRMEIVTLINPNLP